MASFGCYQLYYTPFSSYEKSEYKEEGAEETPTTHTHLFKLLKLISQTAQHMDAATVFELQRKVLDYTASLFHEGFLDDHFKQLRQLQDESNPNFVAEVVTLFFEDSQRILNELTKALEQNCVDFKKMDAQIHQLKGSSSSLGAQRVQRACIAFRNYCNDNNNIEGSLKCLQQVKHECSLMKAKFETLFKLEQQVMAVGGPIPS